MTAKTIFLITFFAGLAYVAWYELRPGLTRMELPRNGNVLVITRRREKLFTPLKGETDAEFKARYQG